MTLEQIKEKLIRNGIRNLTTFGYEFVTEKNILTDDVYKLFFKEMLESNLGIDNQVDKAINDLLTESEEYLISMGDFNWNFVKEIMLEKKYITKDLFSNIDEDLKDNCKILINLEIKESVRIQMKNALRTIQRDELDKRKKEVTESEILRYAENIIVKKYFIELRNKENFKFL